MTRKCPSYPAQAPRSNSGRDLFTKAVRLTCIVLAFLATPALSSAATLIVDGNGTLTGARGVDVGGELFDVFFADMGCDEHYFGCNQAEDFAFDSQAQAAQAATALLEQVFINSTEGAFDTQPGLTLGCSMQATCNTLIPYSIFTNAGDGTAFVTSRGVINDTSVGSDLTFGDNFARVAQNDLGAQFTTPNRNLAVFSPAAGNVDLQVDQNGVLTGARGVIINGTSYDVEFVTTSCINEFDGCDDPADFPFQTPEEVRAAAQALHRQVLVDGLEGSFGSDPSLINGCTNTPTGCNTFIPYAAQDINAFSFIVSGGSVLQPGNGIDDYFTSNFTIRENQAGNMLLSNNNMAVFTVSSDEQAVVPAPLALGLLSVALLPLFGLRRATPAR